ncbi:MAG TPA: recombinase family protein [Desulfitobacteriaceae bacterium]|nr:recombinase family protein [Desulfitobacteriaceae bacterium]
MDNLRVVAYARVSSKEQAEKELSIPAQLAAIRKYSQDKGWKLIAEYLDEGKSAKTADRPAFQRMISLAKKQNRNFDAIVVHKFDRFSRSREDHVIYKALLRKQGVIVYSATEQTDPDTPHGFLLEGMLEVISEFYNMNLANETRKGMVQNAKQGYHNGGSPPYGYRVGKIKDSKGKEKSVWVLGPPEEVDNIRRIFDLYVNQGKGYKVIVNILNTEGTPSPGGKKWGYSTVSSIIHNDAYIGRKVWNRYDYVNFGKKKKPREEWIVVENAQPAIVDIDTFNTVIKKAKERNSNAEPYRINGPSPYLLRGLLKCPSCGSRMVTGRNGKSSRNYSRYYQCGTYHRNGPTLCKRNSVPKDKLESAVIDCLIREFSLLSFPGSLEDEIRRYSGDQNREATFQLSRIDDDIKHTTKRIDMAKNEKILPDANPYIAQYISELELELEKLKSERDLLAKSTATLEIKELQFQLIRDQLKDFANRIRIEPPDVQHLLLKQYVDFIVRDHPESQYMLQYNVGYPNDHDESRIKLLQQTAFFKLH